MKLGILYPRSTVFPLLGADLLSGINASLQNKNIADQLELITASVGFGGNEREVYALGEKMIIEEKVDILVAFLDLKVSAVLNPLINASGKLFIVINPGANYPENWVPQRGTIYLTLQDSFLSRLTGVMASRNGSTQALMAASFYDGGYNHCSSMINAYNREGGQIVFNYVSPQKRSEFNIAALETYLSSENAASTMLCLFSGHEANLFYEGINKLPNADQFNLFVSPAMLDEQICAEIKDPIRCKVQGYIAWHSEIASKANSSFKSTVLAQSNRAANIFSLLGWEIGLILENLVASGKWRVGSEMVEGLYNVEISSPRGKIKLDPATHYFLAPAYSASLGHDHSVILHEPLANLEEEWDLFVKEEDGVKMGGWLNTYLCY